MYELENLQDEPIDGQFYAKEFTPVRITRRVEYLSDKILEPCVRGGFRERLVRWRRYSPVFESWIPDIRRHGRLCRST